MLLYFLTHQPLLGGASCRNNQQQRDTLLYGLWFTKVIKGAMRCTYRAQSIGGRPWPSAEYTAEGHRKAGRMQ